MGITYQVEAFSSVIKEALPLTFKHFKEIAVWQDKISLKPDWDAYYARERLGGMVVVTARSNGLMVGYMIQVIGPGLHFTDTIWSFNDVIWLDPNYREGMNGIKLILAMEKALKERGVKVFEMNPKLHFEKERGGMQKILDRMGFTRTSTIHQKWIGD